MRYHVHQKKAENRTGWLMLLFALLLFGMGVLVHLFVVFVTSALGAENAGYLHPSAPSMVMIALLWGVSMAGMAFRRMDVKGGGAVLARRFGAVQASTRDRHFDQKRLCNVVAEMTIAAGLPPTQVFVLPHDSHINAFVLGTAPDNCAIVVTQGALDAFDRAELQAVIAHELAHIRNGDLPLNMRLLVVLAGLLAIDEVGAMLIRGGTFFDERQGADRTAAPAMIVGLLFRIPGFVGSMCASVLRAAVSRQREFLADATAVEITRQSLPLASALDRIRADQERHALASPYSRELQHLCFHNGSRLSWLRLPRLRHLFATHPSIARRITAIEPHFKVKQRKRRRQREADRDGHRIVESARVQGFGPPVEMIASGYAAEPGENTVLHGGDAGDGQANVNRSGLSDRLLLLLPNPESCLALLFALFAGDDSLKRREYLDALTFTFNETLSSQVKSMLETMPDEIRNDRLRLIKYATANLNGKVEKKNRQIIMMRLEKMMILSGQYSLQRYATLQLIRRKLGVDFPVLDTVADEHSVVADGRRVKRFDEMGREFALLLSMLVEASGADEGRKEEDFRRTLACYTNEKLPRRRNLDADMIPELEQAFQTLYVQPEVIRRSFVNHCIEIARHDGIYLQEERLMVDLFAAALGCEEMAQAA